MADVTGALHHEFGGKAYTLKLSFAVLAELQAKHGMDCFARLSAEAGKMPDFGLMVDIVAHALMRGSRIPPEEAHDLADDMATTDQSLIVRLMSEAFPDAMAKVGDSAGAVGKARAAAA